MESIFIAIDPRAEEKGGPGLLQQLTKQLGEAADKLDEEAIGHPKTVARLQTFLGNTLANLGDSAKAVELHSKAKNTREKLLGPDHPQTLTSMNNLAYVYQAAGQLSKALPLYEDTLLKRKAKLGPDHPRTLWSMDNLALAYFAAKEPATAVPLVNEYLAVKRKQFGAADPRFAGQLASVALDLLKNEQYAGAEPMLRECLDIRVKSAPHPTPGPPSTPKRCWAVVCSGRRNTPRPNR